jgi:hypothetical protein
MKLKSETKQTIEFLKHRFEISVQEKTLLDSCKMLNLNYDMVQRALILLHKASIISRDSRGPRSYYTYPSRIGIGDIIEAIEGLELGGLPLDIDLKQALNITKI